jgi:hypothetical protein
MLSEEWRLQPLAIQIYKTAINIYRLIEAKALAGLRDDGHSVFQLLLQTLFRHLVEPAPSPSTTAQFASSI